MSPKKRVVVLGGGIIGLSIALRLAQAGAKVTVVERGEPGGEASSAAAGILGAQAEVDGPGPFLDLCLKSRSLYPRFVSEVEALSQTPVGYLPQGVLQLAFDEVEAEKLEQVFKWQTQQGLGVQRLTADSARALEPRVSERTFSALYFPDDHQVDNRLLVRALAKAAVHCGATLHRAEASRVLQRSHRVCAVELQGGSLEAEVVVVASGAWSGLLDLGIPSSALRPIRGQMVQLDGRTLGLRHVLFSQSGYLVPRADGRVLAGSTMEDVGFRKEVTASGLSKILNLAVKLCPAASHLAVQETWSGLRPATPDGLPILGPGPMEGLVLATGHFRNGILLAPVTAELVCELVLDQKLSLDLRPYRFDRL